MPESRKRRRLEVVGGPNHKTGPGESFETRNDPPDVIALVNRWNNDMFAARGSYVEIPQVPKTRVYTANLMYQGLQQIAVQADGLAKAVGGQPYTAWNRDVAAWGGAMYALFEPYTREQPTADQDFTALEASVFWQASVRFAIALQGQLDRPSDGKWARAYASYVAAVRNLPEELGKMAEEELQRARARLRWTKKVANKALHDVGLPNLDDLAIGAAIAAGGALLLLLLTGRNR